MIAGPAGLVLGLILGPVIGLTGCGAPEPREEPRAAVDAGRLAEAMSGETALAAARAAGEYLLGIQTPDGSFAEVYDAGSRALLGDTGDNHLLQAEVCSALFSLYQDTAEERFRSAADRGLGLLLDRVVPPRPEHRSEDFEVMTDGTDQEQGSLGATAATLSARIDRAAATVPGSGERRASELDGMRRMGRFLLLQQNRVGKPTFGYRLTSTESRSEPWTASPPGPPGEASRGTDRRGTGRAARLAFPDELYAPSQAAWALVRLSRLDPANEDLWRQGAERFLGWIMAARDLGKTYDRLPHDPWLLAALTELYEVSGGGRTYFLHARRTAAGILRAQNAGGEYPDRAGSFFLSARALPAARRAEALASMARMAVDAGEDPQPYLLALEEAAGFLLRCQLGGDATYREGGVRDGLEDGDVSTGTVLHAINAWLGLRRRLLQGNSASLTTAQDG